MTNKIKRIISAFAIFVVCCCCFSTTAHAKTDLKTGVAIVKGSSLRLRESHSLSARVLDYAEKGDYVVVSGKVGNWYKVNYNLQTGYMHENYLSFIGKENVELGYGSVSGSNVNVRTGPSTQYSPIKRLQNNDLVYIIGINNGWYKVISENSIGYMRSDYVELTEIPYENADSNNEPLFFEKGKWMCNSIDTSLIQNKNGVSVESDVNKEENVLVSKNDIITLAEQNLGAGRSKFATIQQIVESTKWNIESQLAEVSKFLRSDRTTVKGEKKFLNDFKRNMEEKGYGDLVQSPKDIYNMIDFMEHMREQYGDKVFDSGDAMDVLQETERLNIPISKVKEYYEDFASNLSELENMPTPKSGRAMSAKKVNALIKKFLS